MNVPYNLLLIINNNNPLRTTRPICFGIIYIYVCVCSYIHIKNYSNLHPDYVYPNLCPAPLPLLPRQAPDLPGRGSSVSLDCPDVQTEATLDGAPTVTIRYHSILLKRVFMSYGLEIANIYFEQHQCKVPLISLFVSKYKDLNNLSDCFHQDSGRMASL